MSRHVVRQKRVELQQRIADWLDMPLAVLAIIMLGLLIVDLTMQLSPAWERRVSEAETAIWVIFAADFVFEFALAPSKLDYLRHNWLTAIAVILPAFRVVRILRAVQLLRGLSLVRILTTVNRGTRALEHVVRRGQLGYVLLLTAVVTITAGAGAYYFEHDEPGADIKTLADALWWAVTLVTTINVSLEPRTLEGRVIGILLRLFALAVTGYLTATIAAFLIGGREDMAREEGNDEIRELRAELVALRNLLEAMPVDAARRNPAPAPAGAIDVEDRRPEVIGGDRGGSPDRSGAGERD